MEPSSWIILLLVLAILCGAKGSDSDPVQDFCVADHIKNKEVRMNGFLCKDPHEVSAADFVYSGIRNAGNASASATGFAGTSVSVEHFAGLNTMGMSVTRADFLPGGVNVPHLHPRATEVGHVLQGTLFAGFVSTNNTLYAKIISKGDLMIFPRGLVHFQINIGKTPAVIIATLNSQNPGLIKLPDALFATSIPDQVLGKSFKLSNKQIRSLKKKFAPPKNPA